MVRGFVLRRLTLHQGFQEVGDALRCEDALLEIGQDDFIQRLRRNMAAFADALAPQLTSGA